MKQPENRATWAHKSCKLNKDNNGAELLFHGSFVGAYAVDGTPWDISPDGKRFLMIKPPQAAPAAEGAPRKINIVLNWLEDLKQKVPVP